MRSALETSLVIDVREGLPSAEKVLWQCLTVVGLRCRFCEIGVRRPGTPRVRAFLGEAWIRVETETDMAL